MDARAELLRSAPAEASQPTRLAPEFKVVDAASVLATGAAASAFRPRRKAERPISSVRPRYAARGCREDACGETHRPPATRLPPPRLWPRRSPFLSPRQPMTGRGWMATLLGMLLMALGLVSVLGSSPTLREAVLLRD